MDFLCTWPAFAIFVSVYLVAFVIKLKKEPDSAYLTHFVAIPCAAGALGVKFFDSFMADFLMFILFYFAGALVVFLLYMIIGRIFPKELVQNIVLVIVSVVICVLVMIIHIDIKIAKSDSSYRGKSQNGYYDSHGGYHSSEEDREHWNDVYDWMDKNW